MENNEMNSIDALRANIIQEKNIVRESFVFLRHLEALNNLEKGGYSINIREKKLLTGVLDSLVSQLKILNDSVPEILKRIEAFKELLPEAEQPAEEKIKKIEKEKLVSFRYKHPAIEDINALVTIKKGDRLRFLRELSLTDSSVKRLKKDYRLEQIKFERFKKPSLYAKISNRLFLKLSTRLFDKGYFQNLNSNLRKANFSFLSQTYISMAFFSALIGFVASIIFLIVLLFFNLGLNYPFLTLAEDSILLRLAKNFWIIFAVPILTFVSFYFYPTTEKRSIAGKINQELPFVAIHMSAIAGSGIEPTSIFKIIVLSEEYPATKQEIKKLLNQINLYGYDLVSALRESARITSSAKLAELFKGLATTITSGGSLENFLEKRAESLIFDYKMDREKYTKMAETFMDLYISVVIATPMIMTILLVMMNMIPALSLGLSTPVLSFLMILGIALINIFFLVFLHLRQPEG